MSVDLMKAFCLKYERDKKLSSIPWGLFLYFTKVLSMSKLRYAAFMADNVTQPTDLNAERFLADVEHTRRREDAEILLPRFKEWTGMAPVIWTNGLAGKPGSGIVGFGHYHYRYSSGREGDWFLTGFSPRKQNMAIYIMPGFKGQRDNMERLGPHKHSVSCLYLTNLSRNDLDVLGTIVTDSLTVMKGSYDWKAS